MGDEPGNDPRLGTVLGGRFRIDAVLGQGGMGTVYRGTQLSVDRPVAIKLISHQVATQPEFIRRFSREAKVTSQLSHPHTIRLHDFGSTDDGALFLVIELLEGRELSALMEAQGRLEPERALRLMEKLLKSLAEAHAKGIVHRDLKPDNVFLCDVPGEGDFPKVMDFGIASAGLSPDATKLTMDGSLLGTPAYMSPEQAQGAAAGPAADIYALGVMLYEMLTGELPFTADSAISLLMKHVSEAPPPLRQILPAYPAEHPLQKLLDRWLEKDPERRTQDAEQALAEVQSLLSEGGFAGSARGGGASAAPAPYAAAATLLGTLSGQGRRSRGWLWAASAFALAAVVGLVGSSSDPAPERGASAAAAQRQAPAGAPGLATGADDDVTPTVAAAAEGGQARPEGRELPSGKAPPEDAPEPEGSSPSRRRSHGERARAAKEPQAPPMRQIAPPPSPARSESARFTSKVDSNPATDAPAKSPAAPPRPETRKEKRLRLAAEGPGYPSIAAVRRAYDQKRLDRDDYEDIVWALKRRYKLRIRALKLKYKAGEIDRAQYDRLAHAAEAAYRG